MYADIDFGFELGLGLSGEDGGLADSVTGRRGVEEISGLDPCHAASVVQLR